MNYPIENAVDCLGCKNDARGRPLFDFVRVYRCAIVRGSVLKSKDIGFTG